MPLGLFAGLALFLLFSPAPTLVRGVQTFSGKVVARIGDNVLSVLMLPADYTERFFVPYLILSLAAAALILWRETPPQEAARFGLVRRLFPRQIYWHPSARIDYGVALINRVLTPALLITRLLSATAIGGWVTQQLTGLLGPHAPLLSGTAALLVFTLLFTLTSDFADWAQHFLHHRSRLLWEFHKLHHSAEVLTPLSAMRVHPGEQIVGSFIEALSLGIMIGASAYWLMDSLQPITLFGAQLMTVFFYTCCGVHLRHSHVWLSWSSDLGHLLISPAQHQIHHSNAARHWNKNYGNVLAIWDWMFGSLYVPREREALALGLGEGQPHPTLLKAYLVPITGALGVLAEAVRCCRKVEERTRHPPRPS